VDKTLIHHLESFKAIWTVCTETAFCWLANKVASYLNHFILDMERVGFISYTATSHQGAIEMLWRH